VDERREERNVVPRRKKKGGRGEATVCHQIFFPHLIKPPYQKPTLYLPAAGYARATQNTIHNHPRNFMIHSRRTLGKGCPGKTQTCTTLNLMRAKTGACLSQAAPLYPCTFVPNWDKPKPPLPVLMREIHQRVVSHAHEHPYFKGERVAPTIRLALIKLTSSLYSQLLEYGLRNKHSFD